MRDENDANLARNLDRLFDAWGRGDGDGIKEFLADDVECRSPWNARPVTHGRDEVVAEMIARRGMFGRLVTEEVLLGVGCVTLMFSADGTRLAVTVTLRDNGKVRHILVCAEAEFAYRRSVGAPA